MRKGVAVALTVQGLSAEGLGLLSADEHSISCPGVFPEERVRVHIDHVSQRTKSAFAHLEEILSPHPSRRLPPCRAHEAHAGTCTGCSMMALDEAAQREAKRVMLSDLYGLSVDSVIGLGPALGYRWSSKRVAFSTKAGLTLGSYTRSSHTPAAMPSCQVDHALIVDAFDQVQTHARALGIRAYDEAKHEGDLRHVWAKTNGKDVSLTLITCDAESEAARALPSRLNVTQVAVSVQSARTNNMRGSQARVVKGPAELPLSIGDAEVHIGALGFLQPNPAVIARAYEELTQFDGAHRDLAFDLYAGAGLTTARLRRTFREVVASEAYEESAEKLGIPPQTTEQFLRDWLQDHSERVPDLVVANPPRKGLQKEACAALLTLGAQHVAIMSCGPKGLAEDLERLSERYALTSISAYDSLPQTPHVELVAKLALRA